MISQEETKIVSFIEEIVVLSTDINQLYKSLSSFKHGFSAFYIKTADFFEEENALVENLHTSYKILNLNPKIPYPTYIITSKNIIQDFFPQLYSISQLPRYFDIYTKKIKTEEKNLLKKCQFLQQKLKSLGLYADYLEQKKTFVQIKKIKKEVNYLYFLEKMIKQIK